MNRERVFQVLQGPEEKSLQGVTGSQAGQLPRIDAGQGGHWGGLVSGSHPPADQGQERPHLRGGGHRGIHRSRLTGRTPGPGH